MRLLRVGVVWRPAEVAKEFSTGDTEFIPKRVSKGEGLSYDIPTVQLLFQLLFTVLKDRISLDVR
ncbi:MAG: hypothetical protein HQK56_07765 [Deltaproteobacteria bacterium]|nr:hypothetical protein [Deltaproteobacteria bacterium]